MVDIFGIDESSRFAKALAKREGLKVKQEESNAIPYTDLKGTIHIGIPSIYNHAEYMGSLHREISKQMEEVSYFSQVQTEPDTLQDICKDIIQTERTERHQHKEYQGRDRILRDQYKEDLRKNGGLQQILKVLAKDNPTVAAVMYINNELRNGWQGYNHAPVIPEIQDELDRLGFLEDEWESLETAEDLQRLLYRIEHEEPPEKPPSGGEGDEGSGDGTGGDGANSGSSSGDKGAEGQSEDDAGSEDGTAGGEGSPEDGSGDAEEEEQTPPSSPEEQGQEGDRSGSGEQESPEGEDPAGQDKRDPGIGAGLGARKLKDMGLVKKPVHADDSYFQERGGPYTPTPRVDEYNVADMPYDEHYSKADRIAKVLEGFSLSRKVKKYLLSIKQTDYEYGLKRGKICSKDVAKLYSGGARPAIFKQRQASRIQQDTAVFILGDCSGSMSGQKYYTSSAAQIAISEVLQALRIAHAMMQFTTDIERIHYMMKPFGERSVSRDTLIKRYGNGDIDMGCNADGEAVTRAAQLLAARPESQKILIVLSDGSPAWGSNSYVYLKDTVVSIEQSKVMDIIGIGIEDKNVERFYKTSKVIKDVRELEPVLLSLLKDKVLR